MNGIPDEACGLLKSLLLQDMRGVHSFLLVIVDSRIQDILGVRSVLGQHFLILAVTLNNLLFGVVRLIVTAFFLVIL